MSVQPKQSKQAKDPSSRRWTPRHFVAHHVEKEGRPSPRRESLLSFIGGVVKFEELSSRIYYLLLAVGFVITFVAAFLVFLKQGRSFIWGWDGVMQHYPNLVYLKKWVGEALVAVASGQAIPTWSMQIGLGQDVLNAVNFRPLNLLSLLFPTSQLVTYFLVREILCLAFGAVAFSMLARKLSGSYTLATLLGALGYVFCGISMAYFLRHAIFSELLFYIPLFFLGLEKALRKESPSLLVIVTAFCAAAYFYNLFTVCVAGFAYATIRILLSGHPRHGLAAAFFSRLCVCLGSIALGLGISAVLLFPNLYLALSSGRAGGGSGTSLLYDLGYYIRFFLAPVSTEQFGVYGYIGVPTIVFLACASCFFFEKSPRVTQMRTGLLLAIVFNLIPCLVSMMNGFSGNSNRFSVVLAFTMCLVASLSIPQTLSCLRGFSIKKRIAFIGLLAAYAIAVAAIRYLTDYGTGTRASTVLLMLLVMLVLATGRGGLAIRVGIVGIFIIDIGLQGYYLYSWGNGRIASEYLMTNSVESTVDLHAGHIMSEFDTETADTLRHEVITTSEAKTRDSNYGLRSGFAGVSTYYSYSPSSIVDGVVDLGISQTHALFRMFDFDQRSALNMLAGVRYTAVQSGAPGKVAYGSNYVTTVDDVSIYENEYALPLLYAYGSAIPASRFDALPVEQKEWAMLQGAAWDDNVPVSDRASLSMSNYTVATTDDLIAAIRARNEKGDTTITYQDGAIEVTEASELTLEVAVPLNTEVHVVMDGVQYVPTTDATSASVAFWSGTQSDSVILLGEGNQYATGARDVVANLGYTEWGMNQIQMKFAGPGVYKISSLEVQCQPMNDFKTYADSITRASEVTVSSNAVSGVISLNKTGYLCLAVPYSGGWLATIDGEPAEIVRANEMFMGVVVPAGTHTVTFTYHTPLLLPGFFVTAFSLVGLVVLTVVEKKRLTRKRVTSQSRTSTNKLMSRARTCRKE